MTSPRGCMTRSMRMPAKIPGYYRYDRYLRDLVGHRAPLDYLAESEPPYWFVRQFVMSNGITQSDSIVELGCGTGYLTYALRRAGYTCVGIDVSEVAIAQARATFEHPEWFMTTEEFSSSAMAADLVIRLEIVEHVPDRTASLRRRWPCFAPVAHSCSAHPTATPARGMSSGSSTHPRPPFLVGSRRVARDW